MRADPVGQPLAGQCLGVGVVGGSQHGDEDLRLPDFTGLPVYNGTVMPLKSTNSFSPARCVCRITKSLRPRQSR